MSALARQLDRESAAPDLFGYVPLTDVCSAFPGDSRRNQLWNARAHFAESEVKRDAHRRVWVRGNAKLPSGQTAESYLRVGALPNEIEGWETPPDFAGWTASQQQSHLDRAEAVKKIKAACRKYKRKSDRELDRIMEVEFGEWARERGLKTTQSAMKRYRRMLRKGLPDRRGRPKSGCDETRFPQDARDYIARHRLRENGRPLDSVIRDARDQFSITVCDKTIQRWFSERYPPFIADYHLLGERRWLAKYATRTDRDFTQYRANEHWNSDHRVFDLLCLVNGKPGRAWLTVFQDMRSRKIVGWAITPQPDSSVILAVFRKAALAHGAPMEATFDDGKDYRALAIAGGRKTKKQRDEIDVEVVTTVLGMIGVKPHFTIPYTPQGKPVESFFGFMASDFDKRFDSYCGPSPGQRPEKLYENLRKRRIEVPTIEDLREQFGAWLETVYHAKTHSGDGMNGQSPDYVFATADPIPKRSAPAAVMNTLLMKTQIATVTRNGVRCNNIAYGQNNATVWKLIGKDVMLRMDPADASHVLVFDVKTRDFLTEARNERLRGATQEDVAEGMRRQRRQNKLAKAALPALQTRFMDTVQHTIAAAARTVEVQRLAAGGETDLPVQRNFELLPGADKVVEAARLCGGGRSTAPPAEPMFALGDSDSDFDDEPRETSVFALDHWADEGESATLPDACAWLSPGEPLISNPHADEGDEPDAFDLPVIEERGDG